MNDRSYVGVALVLVAAAVLGSCASEGDDPGAEYRRLSGVDRGVLTCNPVPAGQPDRYLITHFLTEATEPLPDDIEFVDVIASSPAGWTFEPVAIRGETMTAGHLLSTSSEDERGYEILPLPFRPDGEAHFALGVVVDIPADTELNPPFAVRITGAEYTTSGQTHEVDFQRDAYITRAPRGDDFCTRTKEPGAIFGEDA